MYGSSIGSLIVFQDVNGQLIELFKKSGDQGNVWTKAEVETNNGNSYSVSIHINYITAPSTVEQNLYALADYITSYNV